MEKNLKKKIHLNHVAELLKQTKHCKSAVLPFKNREKIRDEVVGGGREVIDL